MAKTNKGVGADNYNYDFSSLLWRVITTLSPETEIVSPVGFGLIMALVKLGSTGKSEAEIQNALHFSKDAPLGLHYRNLLQSYEALVKRNVHVLIVSSMLDILPSKFRPEFLDYARDHFKLTCSNWNYSNGDGAVKEVNKRFTKASKETLYGILKQGDIHSWTQMILLNGVYFQGLFEKQCQFQAKHTTKEPFYNLNGTTVKVDMMSGSSNFMYARLEDLKCSAIGIPYGGAAFTFVVVLPDAKHGLSELSTKMDAHFFQNVRVKLKSQRFYAKLPRFSASSRISFAPVLEAMGVKAMFKDPPDFHGFFSYGWARHFSKFIQQNLIDVTEKGSVCSAALAALKKAKLLPGQVKFRADHPFLFFVMDDAHEIVIFVGCKSQF
jgi:serpin B